MGNSVYTINKGINQPIEFRGLKAQYIGYLALGLVVLLILFAVLYISGLHPFVCLGLILVLGILLFIWVYRLSNRYGRYGLMKKVARKAVPACLINSSRTLVLKLKK